MLSFTEVYDLETNQELRDKLDSMQIPKVEYMDVEIEGYSTYSTNFKLFLSMTTWQIEYQLHFKAGVVFSPFFFKVNVWKGMKQV